MCLKSLLCTNSKQVLWIIVLALKKRQNKVDSMIGILKTLDF